MSPQGPGASFPRHCRRASTDRGRSDGARGAEQPAARSRALPLVAGAAVLAIGAALGWMMRAPPVTAAGVAAPVQLDLNLPDGVELVHGVGREDRDCRGWIEGDLRRCRWRHRDLYLRAFDSPASVKLPGTESVVSAAFAPDGSTLGLIGRDRTLKRLSLGDGLITDIGASVVLVGVVVARSRADTSAAVVGRRARRSCPWPQASSRRTTARPGASPTAFA